MRNSLTAKPVNFIFAAVVLACAFALARPLFFLSKEAKKEYVARQNAKAICTALDIYSSRHEGAYPDPEMLTGNAYDDVLVKQRILIRYPANPFSDVAAPMKKVPFGRVSPGNFSYRRNKSKKYDYKLIVYGTNGIISECETRL